VLPAPGLPGLLSPAASILGTDLRGKPLKTVPTGLSRGTVTETLQGSFCLVPAAYEMVRAQRADQPKIPTIMTTLKTAYLTAFAVAASFGNLSFAQETAESLNQGSATAYPIKHLVVIFQENESFDHYFATYPVALNPNAEPSFVAKPGTPSVNGLTPELRTRNQNSRMPLRIDRSHAATADQNHDYPNEQEAMDHGLMDKFVEFTGNPEADGSVTKVMDYFDGNTVTAYWNYAQNFAMNDNSFGSVPGPSTPGAINVISGQTHGAVPDKITDTVVKGTVISDDDPAGDIASGGTTFMMQGKNIGDLLSEKSVTWGWFEGGFDNPAQTHKGADGKQKVDYIPHHQPFQYYPQTANPNHNLPTPGIPIGAADPKGANHQYDLTDFWNALSAHQLPSVSYLKAPGYQDGHPGYSDPLLEQEFVVETINKLVNSPEWPNMAIFIAYDDSDGWYDHVMPPVVNESQTAYDFLSAPDDSGGQSGKNTPLGGYQGRFSFGPRMPFIVISPFAKENFVDHTVTDQSSVVRFIEDNWSLGRIGNFSFDKYAGIVLNMFDFDGSYRRGHQYQYQGRHLILDPHTGEPVPGQCW
jgi:phospholipase C